MNAIKRFGTLMLVAAAIMMLAMPAMAGNGKGKGTRQGTGGGAQDRLRDGSCRETLEQPANPNFAASRAKTGDRDGTPDRDRLKDGSCRDAIEIQGPDLRLAADRIRLKDMIKDLLQDGSCLDEES